jgi:predicted ATPase
MSSPPDLQALTQSPAVQLFLHRAQAVQPEFQLTSANAATVAEICVRLEGLPLAIELAAPRIKLLSPQALVARLEHRFEVLTQGYRDLPERQQTLRKTIEWSYDLLMVPEQQLFRRLAVFAGGCTLDALEAVCRADGGVPLNVLETATSLLAKSLVQQTGQGDGEMRLTMLESLREFGVECLEACGEAQAIRRAHAEYFLALAEQAEPELIGREAVVWLDRLEREHDNLRAAPRWAGHGHRTRQRRGCGW